MTDAELERLAMAATPGPWYSIDGTVFHITQRMTDTPEDEPEAEQSKIADSNADDATYIAAASPDAVLALIARLRAAEAERDRLREAEESLKEDAAERQKLPCKNKSAEVGQFGECLRCGAEQGEACIKRKGT